MLIGRFFAQTVEFLRAGQPAGVPSTGYVPVLALMKRQVSDSEIASMASEIARQGASAMSSIDIGVALSKVIDELPSDRDIQRVMHHLVADGWTVQA